MSTQTKTTKTSQINLSSTQLTHYNTLTTTSSKIRYLSSLNYTTSQISTHLQKRYQHIRNVLITPIKNPK